MKQRMYPNVDLCPLVNNSISLLAYQFLQVATLMQDVNNKMEWRGVGRGGVRELCIF